MARKEKVGPFVARPWSPPGEGFSIDSMIFPNTLNVATEDLIKLDHLVSKLRSQKPRRVRKTAT